jgi:nitronate monooxygenase
MVTWVNVALEEGVRFFLTSLGNPKWVVEAAKPFGGVVYHDVTERKWALKALEGGVHGLIAVNRRAGGHAGAKSPEQLLEELGDLGVQMGYAAVQLGTRFIATHECRTSQPYKQAIVNAKEEDIVLTERITGVPVAVINTPFIQRMGTRAGPFARWMLKGRRTKKWMRSYYGLKSVWQLKRSSLDESGHKDYWQAGKSVAGIHGIEHAGDIVRRFKDAALSEGR